MNSWRVIPCVVLVLCGAAGRGDAYHLFTLTNGGTATPARWASTGIVFIADTDGPAGQNFTALCTTATTTWNNVADALDVFGTPVTSVVNFTGANLRSAWGNLTGDGQYELAYDADGSALRELGLDPASVNGYGPSRRRLVGGQAVIDDAFFVVTGTRTNFDLLSTMVHELGHVLGIAHSTVGMHNSSTPDTALDKININFVPTMHPFSLGAGNTARRTLEADDMSALRELYPEPSASANWAHVAGVVLRCGPETAVTGANVRLVNTSNPNIQISRFTSYDGNGAGRYVINYVPAGTYRVVVEPLGANGFTLNRFGNPPTSAENDFDYEYLSEASVELGCLEELPESGSGIKSVVAANGATTTGHDFRVGAPSLAFVIDDTGSMAEEIDSVRRILSSTILALQAASAVTPFPTTAIVTFKDDVVKRVVSNNPVTLQAIVSSLTALGGGDCPESANAALLVAGRMLSKEGVAILFTDADSRADGPSRAAVQALYNSKGVRLFTLLSGTCTGALTSSAERPSSGPESIGDTTPAPVHALANPNGSSGLADEYIPPATLGVESAVTTFSNLSNQTGGFFVAIPGINFGGGLAETTRYDNTGTNLSISAVLPAIALVTPTNTPRGTTLLVEVAGSNTNFIAGQSILGFSGGDITVHSVSVVSPTRLTASVSIAPGAAMGFRDAVVSTALGGGTVEEARGIGVINVTDLPVTPTTLSVSPAQGGQGQIVDVIISAAAVSLTAGSTPSFGSGITVLSTEALDATTMRAQVSIAMGAAVGYRRVSIFTPGVGTTIDNSPTGAFQVTAPAAVVPVIREVAPDRLKRGTTADVTLSGLNTNFGPTTTVAFSGTGITVNSLTALSPTSLQVNVTVASDASLGFRDVTATMDESAATALDALLIEDADVVCAPDVTSQLLVARGPYRFDRRTGRYLQTVTVTNQGADLGGNLVLALDGLAPGIVPTGIAGVTTCAAPAGSPYVSLAAGSDGVLSSGETTTVTLQFTNPSNQEISYSSRALAGTGAK